MACVAPEGALQRLVAVAAVGHAAAGGVHEGGDTVDVRVVGEDAGLVEGLGDVAGNGRGAVHRGEDADVVARARAPVRTAVALEGGALGFRHHGGRPGAPTQGSSAVELDHPVVVHVDVDASRD